MTPVGKRLTQTLLQAGNALRHVRDIGAQVKNAVGRVDRRFTSDAQRQEIENLKEAAQQQATEYIAQTKIYETIDALLNDEPGFQLATFVRRASFTQNLDATASSEAVRFELTLPRMDSEELQAVFADAITARNFPLLGSIIREAKLRARADDADVNDRGLVHEFTTALSALEIPELIEAQRGFSMLRYVKTWIEEAVRACVTLDDPGSREQVRMELVQAGQNGPWTMNTSGILNPADMPAA